LTKKLDGTNASSVTLQEFDPLDAGLVLGAKNPWLLFIECLCSQARSQGMSGDIESFVAQGSQDDVCIYDSNIPA